MSFLSNMLKAHELSGVSPKFPLYIIGRNISTGEYAIPLKGFITSCCGVNLIGDSVGNANCAACEKEMDDATIHAIYGEEKWKTLSSQFGERIFIYKALNTKNEK